MLENIEKLIAVSQWGLHIEINPHRGKMTRPRDYHIIRSMIDSEDEWDVEMLAGMDLSDAAEIIIVQLNISSSKCFIAAANDLEAATKKLADAIEDDMFCPWRDERHEDGGGRTKNKLNAEENDR